MSITTIGYERRTVDDVVDILRTANVKVLVDVRLTPLSRKAGLSRNGLANRLQDAGIDYMHLPQLGNPRDNRDAFRRGDKAAVARYRAVLREPEGQAALDQLLRLATHRRIALMCFEHDAAECHRSGGRRRAGGERGGANRAPLSDNGVPSSAHGRRKGPTMTRRNLIVPALAAIASATALCLPTAANAAPVGSCAEVPYVGVCVPASDQPTPPQQSTGESVFLPDTTSGITVVG